jgi:hypothetical protein
MGVGVTGGSPPAHNSPQPLKRMVIIANKAIYFIMVDYTQIAGG